MPDTQHGYHGVLPVLVITQPNCVHLCLPGIGEDVGTVGPGLVTPIYCVIAPFCRWQRLCEEIGLGEEEQQTNPSCKAMRITGVVDK